jgi:hypothetical protein
MVRKWPDVWSRTGSALRMWMPWICMIALCLPGLSGVASAQVPRIQGQGAAASAMSNAFAAQADDPSALHYNPAGMTQLQGIQFMVGALASGGSTNFTSLTGVTARGDRNGSVAWPPPGHAYITANLKDLGVTSLRDLSVGIGLTVPFGSLTRWPNDGPFRTATTFSARRYLYIHRTCRRRSCRETVDLARGPRYSSRLNGGAVRQGHCGWFQCQSAVHGVAQYGWKAPREHWCRVPESSDLTPERRIIG